MGPYKWKVTDCALTFNAILVIYLSLAPSRSQPFSSLRPSPWNASTVSKRQLPYSLLGADEPIIHFSRPGDHFNPILAELQHDLEHLEQIAVCPQEAQIGLERPSPFYVDEAIRQQSRPSRI